MTELLEKAIAQLKSRDTELQDAMAALILDELEDEAAWDARFAGSQDVLAELAAEAMEEYRAGETQALNPDAL
ncbi:MAG: hypothetical protein AAFY57_17340 [Cyanobacteria bacterium J06642_2]